MGDIANPQLYEITSAQLGVNGQVEQRQVTYLVPKLQADPDGPDVAQAERALLPDKLSSVPRLITAFGDDGVHGVLPI